MPHCGFRAATLFSKNCQVLYLKIELQSKELNCVKAQTKETKDQNPDNHSTRNNSFPTSLVSFKLGCR